LRGGATGAGRRPEMVRPSSCQLGRFNDCPGESFAAIADHFAPGEVCFVDLEDEYWQNTGDTAVVRVTFPNPSAEWSKFVELLDSFPADEFDAREVDGGIVVRLWWD
jgi:hypothetical protein